MNRRPAGPDVYSIHFFGYIGHVRTIPWNRSGRFIVALQTDFQDRMSAPGQAADIVLLDTRNNYAPRVVEQRGGWFLGINYGRLARLRPVTGYPGARDWTVGVKHPTDDGIFKVNP